MATHIGIGYSENPNPSEAVFEAVNQAKTQANQLNIHVAIVFTTIHYSSLDTSAILRKSLPGTKIIGASTAGIIFPEMIATRGIAVLAISSDQVHFGIAAVRDLDTQDMHQAGVNLAKELISDFGQHRRQVLGLFVDGLLPNSPDILSGIKQIFGNAFPIVGGGSSDDFHFKKTFQFYQDKIMSSSACGILMGGQMSIGFGSGHGWKPLGKPRFADKVEGSIIRTIDGKKASLIYEEYFKAEVKKLTSSKLGQMSILYPLGFYLPDEKQYLLRNAVAILNDGSIICQGGVPEGSEVHIMIGNKDYCQEAALQAAQQVQNGLYGKQPKVVLVFESLSRQRLLGRQALKEIQAIRNVFGRSTPMIGMYSYGEIAPFRPPSDSMAEIARTYLQNESIVLLGLE